VVPNGVDTARIARTIGREVSGSNAAFRTVVVGRLIPRKDPLTALAAFRSACDDTDVLVFVGDGAQRSSVVDRARHDGIGDQVNVTGLVEREEVYRQMATSSLFVSTSLSEGLPVSVLEAMACGLPAVLSDIPSHREIAATAEIVPLVRPGDVSGFASEIARFKIMPAQERVEIGRRCRELVMDRFSLAAMQRSYDEVYRAVRPRRTGRVGRRIRTRGGVAA